MIAVDSFGLSTADRTLKLDLSARNRGLSVFEQSSIATKEEQNKPFKNEERQRIDGYTQAIQPESRFVRDAVTEALVFQVVDLRRDEVIFQIPDETIMRMRRAYAEALNTAQQA